MDTRVSTRTRLSLIPVFIALLLNLLVGPLAPLVSPLDNLAEATHGGVHAVQVTMNGESCNGIKTTPGSENTTKEVIGGTLEPGGFVDFQFTFPAEVDGNSGQETWKLDDCVFLNDEAFQKFEVTAFANDVSPVIIQFRVDIPADAPIGAEYCNYGKTTQTPSDAQASNRKAGPACFIIGGALRVLKVDASTEAALPGATFTVACDWPDVSTGTFLPDTILSVPTDGTISGTSGSAETINSTDDGSFTRTVVTGSQGVISVNGPDGTVCTFTETDAPAGYVDPTPPLPSVTLTIDAGGTQATHTFTNTMIAPNPTVTKTAVASPIVAGTSAGFNVTVSGGGTGSATDVTLTDIVPAGHTWTVTGDDVLACTDPNPSDTGLVLSGGQTLTCNFGTMAAGDSASITITTTSTPADCALGISNTATITATGDVNTSPASNSSTASIVVQCPNVSVTKSASTLTVQAPGSLTYTITGSNSGAGAATGVVITDNLDDDLVITSATFNVDPSTAGETACTWTATGDKNQVTCNVGTLAASDGNTDGAEPDSVRVTISVTVPTSACPSVTNRASIASSNEPAGATGNNLSNEVVVAVSCPDVSVDKSVNSSVVVIGSTATFTLTASGGTLGTSSDVILTDTVPTGFTWTVGGANIGSCKVGATTLTAGATVNGGQTITCNFGALSANQTRVITLSGTPATANCAATVSNTATVAADGDTNTANNSDTATFAVRCPTLVIDKVASTDTITISGPNDALVATPSVVTWTLSYTLTNGPVTGAVITDQVPAGFTFLDAVGGTFANGTVTWNLGTLSASGSVTFRTTVNPATISRTGPTVNTAVIDSNETAPDSGQDSVTVTVTPPVLAGNPTPTPAPLPNTATGFGLDGTPVSVPVELLVAFFIGSLGALTLASARTRSRRR